MVDTDVYIVIDVIIVPLMALRLTKTAIQSLYGQQTRAFYWQ